MLFPVSCSWHKGFPIKKIINRFGEQGEQGSRGAFRSAKRGATLVKQVLFFAREFQGDIDSVAERTVLQVKHIISEIKEFARNTFPKTIEIQVGLPDNLRLIIRYLSKDDKNS